MLTTTGFAAQLLGVLIWIIDIHQKEKWSRFFHAFGVNPLIVYVFAGVLANLVSNIRFGWQGETISIKGFMYEVLLRSYRAIISVHCCTLLFVAICWLFGYIYINRNIYIKI